MSHRVRIFLELALGMASLVPFAVAQKPPVPPPKPPSSPIAAPPPSSQPSQPTGDLVMFLRGRVATADGTAVPQNVMVERVCNVGVRQQVYASSNGDFNMELGSRAGSIVDASGGDGTSQSGATARDPNMGIPRQALTTCELRASASGFQSRAISLVDLDVLEKSIDVGVLVVQRTSKIEGKTLSAIPYQAPKEARRAYEKGLGAEKNGKFASARKCFETAVEIYPRYAIAWFELGTVLQKEEQKDAARTAFTRATTIDTKFLPPYLSLALMAYNAEDWTEVVNVTGHILELDPFNHFTGHFLDLDPFDYSEAYFYNSVANYRLNNIEDAEKSARKVEHLDLRPRFPQVHLLLAKIFAQKNNYAAAIAEIQRYLEFAPNAKDGDQVRELLAELEKLNSSVSTKQ